MSANLLNAARQALNTLNHLIRMRHLSSVGQSLAVSAAYYLEAAIAKNEKSVEWREPLTDEQIDDLARVMVKGGKSCNWLARAVERAHGIGGSNE